MAETKQVPGDAAAEGSRDDSYDAPPLVSTQTVFAIGIFVYILASIWPPSLLILTVFVWKLTTYSLRINDEGASRRMLLHEFEKNDKVSDHLREIPSDVSVTQGYWTNSRGMLLHTTTITPKDVPVKAVMCHCHGYAENACYTKLRLFSTLAQRGIAVLMIAYEGHGRSDGHLTLVADFDVLVNDVATYYLQTIKKLFPDVKAFLMGESMGGAVAFHILQEHAGVFAGVAFICPMCKIADNMMPPQWVVDSVRLVAGPKGVVNALGYLPIAPSRGDLKFLSFKLPEKKALFTRSPTVFGRNPRIATGREMIDATTRISQSLKDFDVPFIVQHGKSDRVTDPMLSQALYDESKSKDKTIKLYEGMWHSMFNGEPDENCAMVLNDTVNWILERAVDKERKDQ